MRLMGLILQHDFQWYTCLFFFLAIADYRITKDYGILAGTTFFLFVFSGLTTYLLQENRYLYLENLYNIVALKQGQGVEVSANEVMDAIDRKTMLLQIRLLSADSLVKLLLPLLALVFIPGDKIRRWLGPASLSIALVSCTITYAAFFSHGCKVDNTCAGVLGNPSMSASFIAAILPIAFAWGWKIAPALSLWFLVFTLPAILLSQSSIAFGVLAAWAVLFGARSAKPAAIILAASTVSVIAFLGIFLQGAGFLSSTGRFGIWHVFLSQWAENPKNWLLGTGSGTFKAIASNVNELVLKSEAIWPTLHSEPLQFLITNGALGFIAMLGTYLVAVFRARKEFRESLLLLGIVALFNYPLHLGISAVFILSLTMATLYRQPNCVQNFSQRL